MKYRWSLPTVDVDGAAHLAASLGLPRLLAHCLCNRGFSDPISAKGFLEPRLSRLADPFLLPNMNEAVERLFKAREQREMTVVFGDYDVDGVTSTALLLESLRELGWPAEWFLPHRMEDGYGLSREAVAKCVARLKPALLLAVDCGSNAYDVIEELRRTGIDVIVLDHHQVAGQTPAAVALVNPHLGKSRGGEGRDERSFGELCSVGLAFKLVHALVKRGRQRGLKPALDYDLKPLLDLVALGTIADLVPLKGENRILVSAGLNRLKSTTRPGLIALKKVAGISESPGCYEVGFQLGPRLNAAGRLETAEQALQLLLAADEHEAMPVAQALDRCNRERQQIERRIAEQAMETVRARFDPARDYVLVEGREDWHVGVVGIVASRVLQQFYRPVILVGSDGEHWRGSGRSIEGFDLGAALRECSQFLVRHGGHAMAAGLTIQPGNLEQFRAHLNDLARRQIPAALLRPNLRLDAEVPLQELTLRNLAELARLQPVGQGNPAVQLCARNLEHARPPQRMGSGKQHVKMWVGGNSEVREAVWWGVGDTAIPEGRFDLAFVPQENHYNGRSAVQLKVLDWRPAGE